MFMGVVMAKAKLHELIAVEGDLEGASRKILEETAHVFKDKDKHFKGFHKELKMLSDAPEAKALEGEEEFVMTTTVPLKLDHLAASVVRYWDAVLQKEATNQIAKADLVVGGQTIAKDLPATFLLGLENKLKALRATYENIPTHEPGKVWTLDEGHALKGAYKTSPESRVRTMKKTTAVVLYEATQHHPAQIKELTEDVPAGHAITNQWSGAVSPAQKSDILERIDILQRAVKKARQRANAAEVIKIGVGKALLDYVNSGTLLGAVAPDGDAD